MLLGTQAQLRKPALLAFDCRQILDWFGYERFGNRIYSAKCNAAGGLHNGSLTRMVRILSQFFRGDSAASVRQQTLRKRYRWLPVKEQYF